MSSTKSSGQQCSSSRRRNIVTTTTTAKKQPPLINITASTNSSAARTDCSIVQSHNTNSRRITYSSTTVDARHKVPSVVSEPQARVPLQPRDRNHNARTVTAPSQSAHCDLLAKPSTYLRRSVKMRPVNGGSDRPRQPQLAAKPLRPPLTPKVASKASYSQPVTPLGRRVPNQPPNVAALSTTKDEAASPLAPFLAHNITPRSGSRQSRVESTNTTPSGTPIPERSSEGWTESPKLAGLGVSLPVSESGRSSAAASATAESVDSKFFYASDARSSQSSSQGQRPVVSSSRSPPTFFYANGTSTSSSVQAQNLTNGLHTAQSSAGSEASAPKFLYANGTPDVSARGSIPPSGSGSVVSSTSRLPYSRPTTSNSAIPPTVPPITSRPASPIKAASTPSATTIRSNQTTSTSVLVPPTLAPAPRHVGFRRDSIESSSQRSSRGHSRTGSIPTIESITGARLTQSPTSPGATSPLPSPGLAPQGLTMANIMQAVEAIGEEEGEDSKISDTPSGLQSPTKSVHNDPLNELVINARRERKVQDLEITNASLEAINRTLERQLRKQTAELRRYRRLSRSGRLSLASVASSRVTSGTSTVQGDLPDLSEEEYSEDEQDSSEQDDLSGSESKSMDDPLSPDMRGLTRRKRDEKRLELDLTKHRELLVDSQKINQSLKRCLDWTEVLIKEGKKALDYHVRVSEVELGGRVLAPADEEEEELSHLDETDTMSKPSRSQSPEPALSGLHAEVERSLDDD